MNDRRIKLRSELSLLASRESIPSINIVHGVGEAMRGTRTGMSAGREGFFYGLSMAVNSEDRHHGLGALFPLPFFIFANMTKF